MPRRSLWLLLVACAPKAPEPGSTEGTTGEPPGSTGATTSPTTGETGGHVPVACTILPQTHAEACSGEPCAITVDVEVRCDDYNFAAPGLRVGVGPDLAWLVTASENDAMLVSAGPDVAQRVDVLPSRYSREVILLATDPAGQPHTLASVGPILEPGAQVVAPGVTLHVDPDGVTHEVEGAGEQTLLGFEIGDDAALRAWTSEYPDIYHEGVAAGGTWSFGPVEIPQSVGWQRFGLTREDDALAAGIDGDYNDWRLKIRSGGVEQQLGPGWASEFPGTYALSAPIPLAADAGLTLAAALWSGSGLRVAWPVIGGSYEFVALPDTAALERTCIYDSGEPPDCNPPCHETAIGLEDRAYALAVTDDGAGWLVHVTSHLDQQITYAVTQIDDSFEGCVGSVASDASTGVLHLTRIDFAQAQATEALTQPIGRVALDDLFLDLSTTAAAGGRRARPWDQPRDRRAHHRPGRPPAPRRDGGAAVTVTPRAPRGRGRSAGTRRPRAPCTCP